MGNIFSSPPAPPSASELSNAQASANLAAATFNTRSATPERTVTPDYITERKRVGTYDIVLDDGKRRKAPIYEIHQSIRPNSSANNFEKARHDYSATLRDMTRSLGNELRKPLSIQKIDQPYSTPGMYTNFSDAPTLGTLGEDALPKNRLFQNNNQHLRVGAPDAPNYKMYEADGHNLGQMQQIANNGFDRDFTLGLANPEVSETARQMNEWQNAFLDPMIKEREEQRRQDLANRGIGDLSEAADRSYRNARDQDTRDRYGASLMSIGQATDTALAQNEARRQAAFDEYGARQGVINERQEIKDRNNALRAQAFEDDFRRASYERDSGQMAWDNNRNAVAMNVGIRQQDFDNRMGLENFNNATLGQQFGYNLAREQASNAEGRARQTQQQQRLAAAAEQQMAERQFRINEILGAATGQQLGPMALTPFAGGQVAPVNTAGIQQNAYNQQLAHHNASNAPWNALLGGALDIGAAYAGR